MPSPKYLRDIVGVEGKSIIHLRRLVSWLNKVVTRLEILARTQVLKELDLNFVPILLVFGHDVSFFFQLNI